MSAQTVSILLVEDDDVDAEAVERAFESKKISNPIRRARDGIEALQILRGSNGHEPISRPYIVLLDLKMPRMGGLGFLDELRLDDELRHSVVFVLTTSRAEQDMSAAYEKFIAGYIVKSRAGDGFHDLIGMLNFYWRVVELPATTTTARQAVSA